MTGHETLGTLHEVGQLPGGASTPANAGRAKMEQESRAALSRTQFGSRTNRQSQHVITQRLYGCVSEHTCAASRDCVTGWIAHFITTLSCASFSRALPLPSAGLNRQSHGVPRMPCQTTWLMCRQ